MVENNQLRVRLKNCQSDNSCVSAGPRFLPEFMTMEGRHQELKDSQLIVDMKEIVRYLRIYILSRLCYFSV
jgi:hypothetical protein